jgi:V/A-type H+/Na+-transporting ATPase subunit E
MNAQAILEKIGSDGRQAAAVLLKEAGERAEAIRAESDKKITRLREDTVAKAQAEAAALEVRMLRMAELDERKALLAAKRKLMDQAFQAALAKLRQMTPEQMESFFLSMVLSSCKGTETLIIGMLHDTWYTPAFADKVNAALTAALKPGRITVNKERRQSVTGVIISGEGMEINCTLEALLEACRLDLEAEVASILYA